VAPVTKAPHFAVWRAEAAECLRADVRSQVRASVTAGATVLTAGAVVDGPGWYFEPTVLGDVRQGMPAYDAEVFGLRPRTGRERHTGVRQRAILVVHGRAWPGLRPDLGVRR